MSLTDHQRAVLAHVVTDPDAWQAHNEAVASSPEIAAARLAEKVARWEPDYMAAKDAPGYQTRAQRDDRIGEGLRN